MLGLKKLFAREKTLAVPLRDLAEAVKPFLYDKGEDRFSYSEEELEAKPIKPFNWDTDLTPAFVAEGWQETAQWLQVAFCDESPKGDLYHSLHHILKKIGNTLERTDKHANHIEFDKGDLSILKTAYVQLGEAVHFMEGHAMEKARNEKLRVQFKSGHLAEISAMPFRKMPGADHANVARQLKMVTVKMRVFTDKLDVPLAKDSELSGFKPHHLRYEPD
ncbi:MAG: hypothetical protein ACLFR0_01425 [Alphaproteobacteria bacterium]